MAATGYILPASVDLQALIGADFSTTINLYTDTAQTTAFDLTGYTVSLLIGGTPGFTLTAGSGLTVSAAAGLIVAALSAAQTATVSPNSGNPQPAFHYQLKLVDGSGVVSYPLSGTLGFRTP
jgi:hypothetical protein